MKISVIMASFNSSDTIRFAIESFLNQDYPTKELIVVDGSSTDKTCDIVRSFKSPLITLSSEPDDGIYDAMNKGLRLMTGDAFGCLNSDDKFSSEKSLSVIADSLQTSDIVSGRLSFVREHDGSRAVRVWQPQAFKPGDYRRGYSLPHPSTYTRREVYDRVGDFNTQYFSAGDYDWLLRALENEGFSHSVVENCLVDMRLGGDSTSGIRAIYRNARGLLKVRQDRLGSGRVDLAVFLNLLNKIKQLRSG
jgi:glycosyltransferase involved in cell wall biosynthesis